MDLQFVVSKKVFQNIENNDIDPDAVPGQNTAAYKDLTKQYEEKYCKEFNIAEDGPEKDKKACHKKIEKLKISRLSYYDFYKNKHMFLKKFTDDQM